MTDTFRDELDNFDGEFPKPWIPEPGDILVGVVKGFDAGPAGEYGTRPILIIQDEDSGTEVSVWLLSQVLIGAVQDARPRVGDRIGIKRLPDKTSKSTGRTFKNWLVRIDRRAGDEMPDLSGYMPPTRLDPGADDALPF